MKHCKHLEPNKTDCERHNLFCAYPDCLVEKTFRVKLRVQSLKMSKWVLRGKMMMNRNALDWDDPEHPYNWIKSNFPDLDPAEFGYSEQDRREFLDEKNAYGRFRW